MYRRIVISNSVFINDPVDFLYHVRGAQLLSQRRISTRAYEVYLTTTYENSIVVFADSVRLRVQAGLGDYRMYEFVLDVPENQPARESVEEITETGSVITVFNENGVVICRNTPKTPSNSAPAQTDGTGEMTSEPIDGTGEMKSEHIDGLNTTI